MKEKIVISPNNTKAVEFLKKLKGKKAKIKKHFAQPGTRLSSLKVDFGSSANDSKEH